MAGARDLILRITGVDVTGPAMRSAAANLRRLSDGADRFRESSSGFTGVSDKIAKGGLAIGTAAASAGPALGVATLAIGSLATVVASSGVALGVFGAVAKSAFAEVSEQANTLSTMKDKVELYSRAQSAANAAGNEKLAEAAQTKYTKALTAYQIQLAGLPPAQRAAVTGFQGMKDAWQGFIDKNKPETFGIMATGFETLKSAIPLLQPLFDVGAAAAGRMADSFKRFVDDGSMERLVTSMSGTAKTALADFGVVLGNLRIAFGNMARQFDSDGTSITGKLADLSENFATWSAGPAFGDFMNKASENGPKVSESLAAIAGAAVKIATAMTPLAPVTLAVATALGAIIEAVPPGVLTAVVATFLVYSTTMRVLAVSTSLAAAASKIFALAMAANPITLVVLAVVALGVGLALLWKNSQKARMIMSTAFAGIATAVLTMAGLLLSAWREVVTGVLGAVITVLDALGKIPGNDWAKGAAESVRGFRDSAEEGFNAAISKTEEWKTAANNIPKQIALKGEISDLEAKIETAKTKLKDKNLTAPEKAKLGADITEFQTQLETAKGALADVSLTAPEKTKLRADVTDLNAKIETAKTKLKEKGLTEPEKSKLRADLKSFNASLKTAKDKLGESDLTDPDPSTLKADIKDINAKIKTAKASLKDPGLTKPEKAKVDANITQLLRKKREAQRALNSMKGKTVNIRVNTTYSVYGNKGGSYRGGTFVPNRAVGGPVKAGQPYVVGEEGPELIVPRMSGTVLTAPQTRRALAGAQTSGLGGGGRAGATYVTNIHLSTGQVISTKDELARILVDSVNTAARAGRGIKIVPQAVG